MLLQQGRYVIVFPNIILALQQNNLGIYLWRRSYCNYIKSSMTRIQNANNGFFILGKHIYLIKISHHTGIDFVTII